jgi:hypothetical protein
MCVGMCVAGQQSIGGPAGLHLGSLNQQRDRMAWRRGRVKCVKQRRQPAGHHLRWRSQYCPPLRHICAFAHRGHLLEALPAAAVQEDSADQSLQGFCPRVVRTGRFVC